MGTLVGAFSLIELLVALAVVGILASLLLPALGRGKARAQQLACAVNLRQLGLAWQLYLGDHEHRFPDRRDLKSSLPGGYKPWDTWPRSDPRSGWAAVVLDRQMGEHAIWVCPSLARSPLFALEQSRQQFRTEPPEAARSTAVATYWMWRFDRADAEVPLDNFWGKSPEQALTDLQQANHPIVGIPNGLADIEFVVDVYFPSTASALPEGIRGRAIHRGGRNRLALDGHTDFIRDPRTR
ncbi:MAG: type II secretion system protein [Verrucomicrobia bacterium]|nr:type II secretion system protein [Verrucomicrobiota bacterium]